MVFVQLKPWNERKDHENSAQGVMEQISEIWAQETEAQSFVSLPGMIEGYGGGGGKFLVGGIVRR